MLLKLTRVWLLALALLLVCLTPRLALAGDTSDIVVGTPLRAGTVVIDIIENPGNKLLKATVPIPAGVNAARKAALIHAEITAQMGLTPWAAAALTVSVSGAVVTVTDNLAGTTLSVRIIFDSTGESTALHVVPGGLHWWEKLFRWWWRGSMADRDAVVPVEVGAVVGFDSPAGFQQRVLAGDGIKTAAQLVDELAGSLVAAGFNFNLQIVQDEDYGDMWELVSQPIPVQIMPTPDRSVTIQTSPCWSDYFGTMGISLESPGDSP